MTRELRRAEAPLNVVAGLVADDLDKATEPEFGLPENWRDYFRQRAARLRMALASPSPAAVPDETLAAINKALTYLGDGSHKRPGDLAIVAAMATLRSLRADLGKQPDDLTRVGDVTPEQLDRLEQLAREATPGPWHAVVRGGVGSLLDEVTGIGSLRANDAPYIAALPPAVVLELVAAARLGAAQATALAAAFDQVDAVRLGLSPENWWYGEGFDQALECFEPLRLLLAEAFPGRAG